MRICVLTHTFPRNQQDVSAAFMKEFCDGLVQNGHKVVLLTPFDNDFHRRGEVFKIVTYKYIWPKAWHLLGYSRAMQSDVALKKFNYLLLPFLILFGTIKLWSVIKRDRIELINVHWIIPSGLIALIASKITKVPYVITLPGTDAYLAYKYQMIGLVAKTIAVNAAGVVSNSSWHLNRILDLGVSPRITAVISYPADVSKFKPSRVGVAKLRQKLKLDTKDLVIMAVGRLVHKKGFDYLIRVLPRLVKKYRHIKLVIGGEGDDRVLLERLANRLKIGNEVLLVGTINRDEIMSYYNLADIFVAPSIIDEQGNVDGGPLVVLESMACGKPQIVTEVLGVADVIKDGVNGYVVKQKSVQGLVEALEKLIVDRSLRIKMGKCNRRLVVSDLNTRSIGAKYTQIFSQVT